MRKKLVALLGLSLLMPLGAGNRKKAPMTPNPPDWMGPELYKMAQAAAPGSEPLGEPYKAIAFKEDDKTDWQVNLQPGVCYVFVGVADQTSEELRVLVWDPEGDDPRYDEALRVAHESWGAPPEGLVSRGK